jgi:hypothetical protein
MDTGSDASPTKSGEPMLKDLAYEERRALRREQILKRGSIPEFI